MFLNIPHEMRQYPQWIVWKLDEERGKVPYCPNTGRLASVTDPSTWGSWETALAAAPQFSGIGFVLTSNDPYTFIDLDEPKDHVTEEQRAIIYERQTRVYQEFDSYAELSPSGKGLHIIVRGKVPSGRKRSSIELYSNVRFMTMTGNVYRNTPIVEKQELLTTLWEQMGGPVNQYTYSGDEPETQSDIEILERAGNAVNGAKFQKLYLGDWQDLYPSQSEADFAFVDIVAFYTQNRNQIMRLFRASALGKRFKALRDDYCNYMINKSFDRMLPPIDVEGLRNNLLVELAPKPPESADCTKNRLPNLAQDQRTDPAPILTPSPKYERQPYTAPPGLIGDIARFIHDAAPRPVPEIALAGAIGLMAGVCGRAYNISGTGLNMYVLLLAPTGTGKEAIASGIDKLMAAVIKTFPNCKEFIGPAEIASPQALTKYLNKRAKSFVSIVGEIGIMLKQLTAWNADRNQVGLRRMLLDLYNKSGEGKVVRPTIYSEMEKNTEDIQAPAFSLLGESTPEKFYEVLNESMISEGLLPRFTAIEYHGIRPPLNPNHIHVQPSFQLVERFGGLCAQAITLNGTHKAKTVVCNSESKAIFDEFDRFCDAQINASDKEVKRHLWNRAHIKALKLAALLAVGVNPFEPVICAECANWSIRLVCDDARNLLHRFETGQVGEDTEETKQMEEVKRVIREYVKRDWKEIEKYKTCTMKMHDDKIFTASYLNKRLSAASAFRKDRLGATKAIYRTIENLKNQGDIAEMGQKQVQQLYSFSGKCYVILNPGAFGLSA